MKQRKKQTQRASTKGSVQDGAAKVGEVLHTGAYPPGVTRREAPLCIRDAQGARSTD